ncbi:Protein ERGIC-53 [Tritrichomonas musculus]|uniref:Protein ERGIC-53 n=1 Tax=Tritrichomonas musculus TaxID=1915356 RepID=A0ABR2KDE4_9EUKA
MILLFFIQSILSETSADLVPPFEIDSENKVGFWEFGGSSIVQQNNILLCPPVQYNKGYTWTNVEIPSGSWSVTYKLQISSGTGGGGFGLWFIDKFGASGPLHGGPSNFKGIGVVGTVHTQKAEEIYINILQNLGKDIFAVKDLGNPNGTIVFDPKSPFYITLEFVNKKLMVYFSKTDNSKGNMICQTEINVNIRDNYIGLTAQSDSYTSRFDLYSITFQLGVDSSDNAHSGSSTSSKQRDASLGKDAPSGHYNPETSEALRNPVFQITLQEYKDLDGLPNRNVVSRDATADRLLTVIDEMNRASFDVASFKELNSFIINQLMPYSQKWHTRTLKIVEHVQQARNVMGAAWNYTHLIINNMNSTMRLNSVKTTFKVIDLAELLTSEADSALETDEELVKSSFLVKILVTCAVVEIIALAIFFILIQNESFRSKIFGDPY